MDLTGELLELARDSWMHARQHEREMLHEVAKALPTVREKLLPPLDLFEAVEKAKIAMRRELKRKERDGELDAMAEGLTSNRQRTQDEDFDGTEFGFYVVVRR